MSQRLIAFVSDFGVDDPYAGQMTAAALARAQKAQIVAITHGIPAHDIAFGAIVVAAALERLPTGAILVAVVDPGVGTERRGLVVRASSRWLVGPDNGLLMGAPEIAGVWRLDRPEYWDESPHPTFHGRDVFAPVAGHLAAYVRPDAMGSAISDAVPAPATPAAPGSHGIEGRVVHIDRFGNLITDIPEAATEAVGQVIVEIGNVRIVGLQPSYGSGADPVAVISSLGLLEIAIPSGSAEAFVGARRGDRVYVRPA